MAYKQSNNPFKKLHGDLQGFGEKHAAWKAKREEMPQKKYGHFSEGAKAYRAGKKAGESKFQYDIRMRRERNRAKDTMHDPDKDSIPTGIDATPWGDIPEDQQSVGISPSTTEPPAPDDFRLTSESNFGITDDMTFREAFKQAKIGGVEPGGEFVWNNEKYKFEYETTSETPPLVDEEIPIIGDHGGTVLPTIPSVTDAVNQRIPIIKK